MGDEPLAYAIRSARREEIPQALSIWKETGMQEGTHCLETWMEIDPDCYKVAVTPEGEVLGVCSAAVHHDDLAFVGLYAVKEKYRGFGIGVKLWKACMDHIGDRNAGVNAVPGKLEMYRDRGGFPEEETKWSCLIFETKNAIDVNILKDSAPGVTIIPISEKVLSKVADYDYYVVGYRRDRILHLTIHEDESVSFAAVDAEENVRGYGVLKMSVQGNGLIGPLYADSQDIAEFLLRKMVHSLPQAKGLALMSTDSNPGAKNIANKLGMPEHEKCPRCYKKFRIHADLKKIFGQLDLNFSPV